MMNIELDSKIGQIASEHPSATKVFARHGIDFCCGGGKPLRDACERLRLDARVVLAEIKREIASPSKSQIKWDEAPLADLIQHLLTVYHAPLKEELPRIEAMSRKVVKVHGDKRPEVLPELLTVVQSLHMELEQHMAKEEQVLFPLILRGQGAIATGPISVMQHEHDSAGRALDRLRELTDGYEVPAEACNTWRALWHGLEALEDDLHQHIHLENNILFPRAVGGK